MAVYKTVGTFAKECSGIQNSLRRAMVEGVNASALVTKKAVLAAAEAQRWPRRSKRRRQPVVSVGYTIATRGSNPVALVKVRNGAVYEFGAKPHDITPRRKSVLATPYGPRPLVHHPGFAGRRFWRAGLVAAEPAVRRAFGEATVRSLTRTFKELA